MPVFVAGKLALKPGHREAFIAASRDAIIKARATHECLDFSVSPDPVDENRVNIFEKWTSRAALDTFRDSGPDTGLFDMVESFDIHEHEISLCPDSQQESP